MRDLSDIAAYTKSTHGERQASAYRQVLVSAFDKLGDFSRIGVKRTDLAPGIRCLIAGKHFVLYRVKGDVVAIIAIRHQQEDLSKMDL